MAIVKLVPERLFLGRASSHLYVIVQRYRCLPDSFICCHRRVRRDRRRWERGGTESMAYNYSAFQTIGHYWGLVDVTLTDCPK